MSKDQAKEKLNIRFGGASERSRRYNEIEKLKKEMTNMLDINEHIYDKLLEITSEYFPGKTTEEVIECALVETFSDLQMCASNPRLSVKRYAEMLVQLKNRFIKAQEANHNE